MRAPCPNEGWTTAVRERANAWNPPHVRRAVPPPSGTFLPHRHHLLEPGAPHDHDLPPVPLAGPRRTPGDPGRRTHRSLHGTRARHDHARRAEGARPLRRGLRRPRRVGTLAHAARERIDQRVRLEGPARHVARRARPALQRNPDRPARSQGLGEREGRVARRPEWQAAEARRQGPRAGNGLDLVRQRAAARSRRSPT